MRKTKIVCTIGPATEEEECIEALIDAGMNAARLNFSHGDHFEHEKRIRAIKATRERLGVHVAILMDTKGPEVRLGTFKSGGAHLVKGQRFILTAKDVQGDRGHCSVSYKDLPNEVERGGRILIADGLVELVVLNVKTDEVLCEVVNDGYIGDRKSVNLPGVTSKLPAISGRDRKDLLFGIRMGVDFVAASFIRGGRDVKQIRDILDDNGGKGIGIIAKIENQEGVDNIEDILKNADGIMVARGDLGVELPPQTIPMIQKMLIRKANQFGKPVITATQMLESMIINPKPTRAEVADIANSILDGTDAIMLSGETAMGKYPIKAVKTMDSVAIATEAHEVAQSNKINQKTERSISLTDSICQAASVASHNLKAAAILTPTNSGYTPTQLSRFRPKAPIIAAVHDEIVARRLCLVHGVEIIMIHRVHDTDDLIDEVIMEAKMEGFLTDGDTVVICAGIPSGRSGITNMMKVDVV